MARITSALIICFALILPGCTGLEQYHFPQTQDKVPADVIVAFGDKWPNDVIKSISESKMFDGTTQYTFTSTNSKLPQPQLRMTTIRSDGTVLPNSAL